MTISSTVNKLSYNGIAAQDTFAYTFRVDDEADMAVYLDGVTTSAFSMTGIGNDAGGDVILDTPLAGATVVTLVRTVALTQPVDYQVGGAFPSATHESALDRLTMIAQQLDEALSDRVLQISLADEAAGTVATFPSPVGGNVIGWNAGGTALENKPVVEDGVVSDGSVTAAKLATDSVTTIKIADKAVTSDKVADQLASRKVGTAIDDDDVDGSNILTLPSDGGFFIFSGTQQVDSIASIGLGIPITLYHNSVRQLTHHATDLILPGSVNITTKVGDVSTWIEYSAGDWLCLNYQRFNRLKQNDTEVALNASSVQLTNSLPAGLEEFEILLYDAGYNTTGGTWRLDFTNGSQEESQARDLVGGTAAASSSAMVIAPPVLISTDELHGIIHFRRVEDIVATNRDVWLMTGMMNTQIASPHFIVCSGKLAMADSNELTTINIATNAGVFDQGYAVVRY